MGKNKCVYKPLTNNLIDEIWKRKIINFKKKFFILPERSIDERYQSKINKITNYLRKKNLTIYLLLQVKIMLG